MPLSQEHVMIHDTAVEIALEYSNRICLIPTRSALQETFFFKLWLVSTTQLEKRSFEEKIGVCRF